MMKLRSVMFALGVVLGTLVASEVFAWTLEKQVPQQQPQCSYCTKSPMETQWGRSNEAQREYFKRELGPRYPNTFID